MYAIVAVPFNRPRILYLEHHRAAGEGSIMNLKNYSYQLSIIVTLDFPAAVTYVFGNLRLSEVWHRMQYFILHSMSISLN